MQREARAVGAAIVLAPSGRMTSNERVGAVKHRLHDLIQAGAVWIVTGHTGLAALEFVLHWMIDFAKCENWTGIHTDQALHVACKVAYVLFAL